jgi:clorobiocin biosynthesis protein CloN2
MRVGDIFFSGLGVYVPATRDVRSLVRDGLLPAGKAGSLGVTAVAVAGDTPAPDMALRAAQDAVKSSGLSTGNFGLLVYADVWHQGPEGWEPHYYLQHYLLGDDLLAVEIKGGRAGLFAGLELAVGILRTGGQQDAALVVASDNFGTALIDRWAPGTGFSVLGDAASAVVLARDRGFARLLSVCTATHPAPGKPAGAAEPMFPPGATVGRVCDLAANGWETSAAHIRRNRECAERALAEAEVSVRDIRWVIGNNTPRDEAEAHLRALGFPLDRSTWAFGNGIGHTGGSDQAISLHHLLATRQLSPGDHVLLSGFSPGMTYKAAVLEILAAPPLQLPGRPACGYATSS